MLCRLLFIHHFLMKHIFDQFAWVLVHKMVTGLFRVQDHSVFRLLVSINTWWNHTIVLPFLLLKLFLFLKRLRMYILSLVASFSLEHFIFLFGLLEETFIVSWFLHTSKITTHPYLIINHSFKSLRIPKLYEFYHFS